MRVLIIDGNHLLHRNMRVDGLADLESEHGKPTGGIFGCLRFIKPTLAGYRSDYCFVVFDGGISKRRRAAFPAYKGPRYRDINDPLYEEPDEDKVVYRRKFDYQRSCLLYLLPKLGVRTLYLDGWEGDDAIAALVNNMNSRSVESDEGFIIHVVSDDKDMLQLVADIEGFSVNIVRAIAKQVVSASNFEQIFGCGQQEYELRRYILGDSSDNISGVPQVGKVTVVDIFEDDDKPVCAYPFEDLFLFCDGHKNKRIQRVANNFFIVLRNHDLMNLELEDQSSIQDIISCATISDLNVDLVAVKRFLAELGIFSIAQDFHNWVVPFQRLK